MNIQENVPLKGYTTMGLGGNAKYLCEVKSEDDLLQAIQFAGKNNLKLKVIGSGSNLAWSSGGYDGIVIVNKLESLHINGQLVTIGAGTPWDDAVKHTVQSGLSGIEFLSLIPGTAGATPVQNVGAYGTEIKDVLTNLRAYDLKQKTFVSIDNKDCQFGYRKSRFNQEDSGRFIITEISLRLSKSNPTPPFYRSLEEYLGKNPISESITPQIIRDAVIAIRSSKLPDPKLHANNGSYFANPIITKQKFAALQQEFQDIVGWDYQGSVKIPAAWLIDHAGFKDHHDEETGMATWHKHPLILINKSASSTDDLIKFRDKIINAVQSKFDITLKPEPEIL